MKYFFFAFSLLFILSCNNSQAEAEANANADRQADSFMQLEVKRAEAKKVIEDSIAKEKDRLYATCPEIKKYLELTDHQLAAIRGGGNINEISERYMIYKDSVMLEESRVIGRFSGMDSACKKMYYDRANLLIAGLKTAMGQ